jgi:hypothetical protein
MKSLISINPIVSLHVFMIKNKLFENDNCYILDEFNDLLNYENLDNKYVNKIFKGSNINNYFIRSESESYDT